MLLLKMKMEKTTSDVMQSPCNTASRATKRSRVMPMTVLASPMGFSYCGLVPATLFFCAPLSRK